MPWLGAHKRECVRVRITMLVLLQARVCVRVRVLMRVVDKHTLMPVLECLHARTCKDMRMSTRTGTHTSMRTSATLLCTHTRTHMSTSTRT